MIENRQEILKTLRDKVHNVLVLYERTLKEKKALEEKITVLEESYKTLEANYKNLEQEYETLKIAKALTNLGDKREAKLKISRIVREIDKCIDLLNE